MKQPGIYVLIIISLLLAACQSGGNKQEENRTLTISYVNWAEGVAITNLAKQVMESKLGYDITLKLTDLETAYADVASARTDLFMDAWLPETHAHYLERHKDSLQVKGTHVKQARTGFVVPAYSSLSTIEDLKQSGDTTIVGIDAEAGIMKSAADAIEAYNLPQKLQVSSGPAMAEMLNEAYMRRQEIVVTGWNPHWMFARHELRFLDDPKKVFHTEEQIRSLVRLGLEEDHPVAIEFISRLSLTKKQLDELMYDIRMSPSPAEGVRKWMRRYEPVVNDWTRDLAPVRKKIM